MSVDPFHRVERLELDGAVFDANEPGMVVTLRIQPDGAILFLMFCDLCNR